MLECNDADPQYLELAGLRCPKVYWEFDTEMHWPLTAAMLQHFQFNCVFLANPDAVSRVPGSVYLPYAADDDLFTPGDAVRSGAACLGSPFPERVEFCKQAGVELITGLYRERYVDALQKLTAHVHYHNSGGGSLLVMRVFETIACRTLLIAPQDLEQQIRGLGLSAWYYDSPAKCLHRLGKSIGDPLWAEVPYPANDEVLDQHTYVARAQRILQEVSS
jgi:spore maturation protein CgeB